VIEEIRRLMLRFSTRRQSAREKLNRREPARAAGKKKQHNNNEAGEEQRTAPRESLGSRWISTLEKRSS
jgi:hypothetical protein